MATCKDCIHYYVCNSKGANCREDIGFGSDVIFITESLKAEEQCDEFFPDVVRCKDCKHKFVEYDGIFTCNIFSNCYGLPYRINLDDFCSRGERKENDNEQN